MDEDRELGSSGMRNWGSAEPKVNLGWQLMSNGSGIFDRSFVRDGSGTRANKFLHAFSSNPTCAPNGSAAHAFQFLRQPDLPHRVDSVSVTEETEDVKEDPLEKGSQCRRPRKSPMPKKSKKLAAPKNETSCRKSGKKSEELVINGIDLDLSRIATPVCSCTGQAHRCYKWGFGGWQSACCTRSFSEYPLPASMKRRGARIAGRKMSLGRFKKVLEKLAGEGHNLSNAIDLKPYWAKHGSSKFAAID